MPKRDDNQPEIRVPNAVRTFTAALGEFFRASEGLPLPTLGNLRIWLARRRRTLAESCVFCQIVAGQAPATVIRRWPDAIAITPLGPVVDGHTLVIPTTHVRDALADPAVTAAAMRRAAELASDPCNIITNVGREATQSVFHLHLHIVPRADNDGLALPWYSGRRRSQSAAAVNRREETD